MRWGPKANEIDHDFFNHSFAIAMVLQRSSKSASLSANFARQISLAFYSAHTKITLVQKLMKAQTPIVT